MRRNVRWMLLGNAVYAAGVWLQMMVFARVGGALALGAFAYALALTAPIMMFSYLQLRALVASDASPTFAFPVYRRLRLLTTASALLVIAGVATATAAGRASWPVLAAVSVMRAADALSDLYYGLWQRHERMSVIGAGLVINSVASLAFMLAAAMLGGGAAAVAAGGAAGSCAALVFVLVRTAAEPTLRAETTPRAGVTHRRIARLAIEAAPLGVIVLLGTLLQSVPPYFIQHYEGDAALGLFAAAYQLTAAGSVVVAALGSSALPRLARAWAVRDASGFGHLSRRLALGGAALGAGGVALSVAVGRQVLTVLFRPEFAAAAAVLIVLSLAAPFAYAATLLGSALTAARVIAIQPLLIGASLAVAVVACAALVPAYGRVGAAWAVVLASAVQAVWSAVALVRARLALARAPAAASRLASELPGDVGAP